MKLNVRAPKTTFTIIGLLVGLFAVMGLLIATIATSQPQGHQEMTPPNRMAMMHDGPGHRMGPGGMMGRGSDMGHGMQRHMYYMRNGVPPEYRKKASSLSPTPEVVRTGATLYGEQCASCHGVRGFGDGEAGEDLEPRPANLARMIRMPMFNDAYLFWTISEGGEPFNSAMPAFKETLKEEEIWKIIAAMRAGFPATDGK